MADIVTEQWIQIQGLEQALHITQEPKPNAPKDRKKKLKYYTTSTSVFLLCELHLNSKLLKLNRKEVPVSRSTPGPRLVRLLLRLPK
ncbi:unnamed protein product [Prunus armeniaca]